MKKRILYITADYPPDSTPGATRSVELVAELRELGHEVVVLRQEHRVFPKQHLWVKAGEDVSIQDAISTGRRKITGDSNSIWANCLKPLAFMLPMDGSWWGLRNLYQLAQKEHQNEPFDLIFISSNPLSTAYGGIQLKKKLEIPLVVEFRDPWTWHPRRTWQSGCHFRYERKCEKKFFETVDEVVLNTHVSRKNVIDSFDVPEQRLHVIPHGFIPDRYEEAERACSTNHEGIWIGFVGSFYYQCDFKKYSQMGKGNPLAWKSKSYEKVDPELCSPKPLFDALIELRDRNPDLFSKVQVRLIGAVRPGDREYIDQHQLNDQVVECERIAPRDVPSFLASCDALYLTNLYFTEIQSPFVSTKTIEYLAARRPMISVLPEGDNREIVDQSGLALLCHPGSGLSVREAILRILEMKESGGKMSSKVSFTERFVRRHHAKCLESVFLQACGDRAGDSVQAYQLDSIEG